MGSITSDVKPKARTVTRETKRHLDHAERYTLAKDIYKQTNFAVDRNMRDEASQYMTAAIYLGLLAYNCDSIPDYFAEVNKLRDSGGGIQLLNVNKMRGCYAVKNKASTANNVD